MTFSKLKKQLSKDIQKSPGKAAALGVLTLVALYAWAPLLLKSGKSDAAKKDKTLVTASAAEASIAGVAPTAPAQAAPMPWKEVVRLIEADPYMSAARRGPAASNPFSRGDLERSQLANSPPQQEFLPPATTDTLPAPDMTVSSTMVGKQRRVAVIDGRPYAEGRRIRLASGEFITLAEVGTRYVVVEQDGQRFEIAVRDENAVAARETP